MKRFLVSFIGQWFPANSSGGNGGDAAEGQTGRSVYAAEGFARVMAACITLLVVLSMGMSAIPGAEAAANAKNFDAGYIISDSRFYDSNAMTASQIQTFLNQQVPTCHPEWDSSPSTIVCLKDYKTTSTSKTKDSYCAGYAGGQSQSAAQIIDGVARSCGVSQQILLVLLQKENGLVTHSWPSPWRYKTAMGYGCPDTAACDSQYYGFFNQVYNAARQYKLYQAKPASYQYRIGSNNIYWNPNASCGYSTVTIRNQATAGLYNYTPYQPNQAALNAGYGSGNSCSSYGNRNFYLYYSDWFGDPKTEAPQHGNGQDTDSTVGRLGQVTFADGLYYINAVAKNSSSIEIAGGGTTDGVRTQLFEHNNTPAQQFRLRRLSDGAYEITSVKSGKVLDVEGGNAGNGAVVRQWTANGSSAQRWFVRDSGSGYYIQSALGNWVLDLSGGYSANKTPVALFTPNNTTAQKFVLSSVSPPLPSKTTVKISSMLNPNMVLDVFGASVADKARIQLFSWNGSEAQIFSLNEVGNSVYTIRNVKSSKVLEVADGTTKERGAVQQFSNNGTAAQRWALIYSNTGKYTFVNTVSGKALDVPGGVASMGAAMQACTGNWSAAQRFDVSAYQSLRGQLDEEANAHRDDIQDGTYSFAVSNDKAMSLDVNGGSTEDGARVQIFTTNASDAQRWKVSHDVTGYVTLTSVRSGKVMDIQSGSTAVGTPIQQYSSNGSWAQKWIVKSNGDGTLNLISAVADNRVLDVSGGVFKNNVRVQSFTFNGSTAQQWTAIRR